MKVKVEGTPKSHRLYYPDNYQVGKVWDFVPGTLIKKQPVFKDGLFVGWHLQVDIPNMEVHVEAFAPRDGAKAHYEEI